MICGIIGPPQSGKSTLFNLLTGLIEDTSAIGRKDPRRGVAQLIDNRLEQLAKVWDSKKIIYATVEYIDIPGFSAEPGSSQPYPPKYLAELRTVDVLGLVIRDFQNPTVSHPQGSVDAERDFSEAMLEFLVNDLDLLERRLNKISKINEAEGKREIVLLERCIGYLSDGNHLRDYEFSENELQLLKGYSLLSLKPLMIVLNLDEDTAPDAEKRVSDFLDNCELSSDNVDTVGVAVSVESEIALLDPEDRAPFLEELGFKQSALERVVDATFTMLGLVTFLTAGPKEARAWATTAGSTAVHAAGKIHDDIARGFIRAEIYNWKELVDVGSFAALRDQGKLRVEGKNYLIAEGDVMNIRFNV